MENKEPKIIYTAKDCSNHEELLKESNALLEELYNNDKEKEWINNDREDTNLVAQ